MIKIERAIISVSDKTGIVELTKFLKKYNVEIISTGGTAKVLKENGIDVIEVNNFTGFPEILDGRVKTLHPKIYGGILSIRDKEEHIKQMQENKIEPIQLIVCNLYPFEETLKKGKSDEEIIENIDIGGPTMIRAGAKNYKYVCVLTKPVLYAEFMKEMKKNNGYVSEEFSFNCAREVFRLTSRYDYIISSYFSSKIASDILPDELDLRLVKVQNLRYGENPHQKGAWYRFINKEYKRDVIQGKELSFNNLLDMESAYNLVWQFEKSACVIIKHTNPCGVAVADDLLTAYEKALECDPLSAFGGIVGFNSKVDKKLAEIFIKKFYEIIVAPDYDEDALEIFKKRQDLRVIRCPEKIKYEYDFRTLADGFLVQTPDELNFERFDVVTEKKPTQDEVESLKFAWIVCKFIKSNGIVIATKDQTLGIGTGQMSRYDSTRIAVMKMNDNFKEIPKPVVLASDAFFPFPDSIEVAKKSGISAIIQPGGSKSDEDVIKKCNELGISMIFTGTRHFKH
ncbi:MAG: bifunctional phosphoribosylaminoimidazolecarboxamide formyltransferase/IMP cyclohydrolase [Candidatus Omnitrophica bacterium]|nr:bifunctional phosphoribosylaminoimidazolecarboxamide formyltransferase/IMP cyclohydrolase [Candidatus Omnitrophota bacterium]